MAKQHGGWSEWLRTIEMDMRYANKFIKVYEELSEKWSTSTTIGFEALYQIATLPPEEREKEHYIPSKGVYKTVDEMTVKELREVKRLLKEREQLLKAKDIALEEEKQHANP